jgi:RNA polymerase sigma-70 factor, ECF subfamily
LPKSGEAGTTDGASHTLRSEEHRSVVTDSTRAAAREHDSTQAVITDAVTAEPGSDSVQPRGAKLPPPPRLAILPESDEELFRYYAETDSDRALREIVNRYQPKIMRFFLRNSATRHVAEDLTQEVFIRLIRNRKSYDPNQKFSTWSKTIAERIAINAARGVQRSRVTSFSDLSRDAETEGVWNLDPGDLAPLPDAVAERRQTRALIDDALLRVEQRYREPARLHFLEGLTHTEAARRLGIPVGTAKSRTHRAIEDLRSLLTERGLAA